jgi:hypothetical protein
MRLRDAAEEYQSGDDPKLSGWTPKSHSVTANSPASTRPVAASA